VPKAASAAAADNPHAGTAADVHTTSAHVQSTTAMHYAHAAAPAVTSASVTSAAVTSAPAGLEHGRRQKQARGDGANEKRGAQHNDPSLERGCPKRTNVGNVPLTDTPIPSQASTSMGCIPCAPNSRTIIARRIAFTQGLFVLEDPHRKIEIAPDGEPR
jgi:hypothetical protein